MRKLFLQKEVIEIGHNLGWVSMGPQHMKNWTDAGYFKDPAARVGDQVVWYRSEDIVDGFCVVAKKYGVKYDEGTVREVMKDLLAKNKQHTKELLDIRAQLCEKP
jgi:hypothetical protein